MDGRLETERKILNSCHTILDKCPLFVSEWFLNLQASDKTAASCRDYLRKVYRYLNYINEDTKNIIVEDINHNNVGKYFISLKTREKNGEIIKTSDSYRQTVWCCLNNFFEFLLKRNYIESNPMQLIQKPSNRDLVRINEHRILLQKKDFKKILNAVENGAGTKHQKSYQEKMKNRDLSILLLFMGTGIRKTALSEINVDSINFDTGELFIQDKGNVWHKYKLTEYTIECIKLWLNDRKYIETKSNALFISKLGTRLSGTSIDKLVDKYCYEGLGYHISPHKLRAGFCSIMYKETGDIEMVRRMVGHSNVSTTQRYIVTGGDEVQKANEIMTNIFG